VLDRLFTYAAGNTLSKQQLDYLAAESKEEHISLPALLDALDMQLNKSLERLKLTDANTLTEIRMVGRKQIPSTVMGLLFHAAEHTMRHTGQLLVTARVLKPADALN
jgi:uncharacterized damage-inducible protein DinB